MTQFIAGIVTRFDQQKGFGFIKSHEHNEHIFIHIKNVNNKDTLTVGDRVKFELTHSNKGAEAINLQVKGQATSPIILFTSIALFLIGTLTFFLKDKYPLLEAYLFAVNGITVLYYFFDKLIAGTGFLRVPENTLHFLSLIGGWPAALFSQNLFRHKTVKRSFRQAQFIVISLWVVILGLYIYFNPS